MTIHSTAVIDSGVELGEGVCVGPFAVIEHDVKLGDGCRIGPHTTLHAHTTLGAGCVVHAGAVLGDQPQDMSFGGGESSVKIGQNCVIREGVTIHRGTEAGSSTVVGDDCFFMAFSHVGHNCVVGNNVIMANGAVLAGYVEVGERVFISSSCGVHQFCKIGRLAMIGGLAGVSKDVPPFCTLRNTVMNDVAGLNVVGMRRAGIGPQERAEIKKAYKLMFRSGLNISQAIEQILAEFPSGAGREMAEFALASKRGICVIQN